MHNYTNGTLLALCHAPDMVQPEFCLTSACELKTMCELATSPVYYLLMGKNLQVLSWPDDFAQAQVLSVISSSAFTVNGIYLDVRFLNCFYNVFH